MSKLNRKISAIIISCALIVCNSISIFAAESVENEAVGYLTLSNGNGTVYKVDIYPQDVSEFSTDDSSITYTASTDDLELIAIPLNGDMGDSYWDPSGSVLFNMRLYYSEQSNPSTVRLDKVTGNLSVKQANITYSNQKVNYQCSNPSVVQQQNSKYPTGSSFSYNTGFSKYVPAADYSSVGAAWSGKLTRGSSWTWQFNVYRYN